ncbi:MAG TPA: hypothetical protein VER58_17625 [Thermoanaerobaculia bacterium]|nr:hypothetical protein [Thermoanaerobaculia bacterium]
MENFLNLLWLTIALGAMLTVRRRSRRVSLAIGCALALLFPIISVSDDLIADRDALEEALALVVEAVILVVALVVVAKIESIRDRRATLFLIPLADPRSPPRAA